MNSKLLCQLAFRIINSAASLIVGGRLVSEFHGACGDETEFRCWAFCTRCRSRCRVLSHTSST